MVEHCYALSSLDLSAFLKNELEEMEEKRSWYSGYMQGGVERCNSLLKQLKYLGFYYVVRHSVTKSIESGPRLTYSNTSKKIDIAMFGPPFYVATYYYMRCIRGQPRDHLHKNVEKKNRSALKKMGCPGELHVKIIKYFPKYSVSDGDGTTKRHKIMAKLKEDMSNPNFIVEFRERVYICISKENIHTHKPLISLKTKAIKTDIHNGNNKDLAEDENDSVDCEENESKTAEEIVGSKSESLSQKQDELRKIANDIATISNVIHDKALLEKSIEEMKCIFDKLSKPFMSGVLVNVKKGPS